MKVLRHIVAIILLPGTATVVVPLWICRRYGVAIRSPVTVEGWLAIVAGVVLAFCGIALFVSTVALFAGRGEGTLAPWDPPKHLVVRGPYRFVRNPMISGVILLLCAEALVFRSIDLGAWAAAFAAINAIYIPLLEEPVLEHRFGDEYRRYRQNVPRLIPRLRPWKG